jgi:hypothetical protein
MLSRDWVTTKGIWIGNRIYKYLQKVDINNYVGLTELHTSKITVTTAHKKSPQFSLAVAW